MGIQKSGRGTQPYCSPDGSTHFGPLTTVVGAGIRSCQRRKDTLTIQWQRQANKTVRNYISFLIIERFIHMATLNMGILGGFSGTVGTVVGSTNRKGDDIIRAKTKNRKASNTDAQIEQRSKFGLTTGFLQSLNPLLQIGLKQISGNLMTPFNYACKQVLKDAITGESPNFGIDYSKVLLSDGSLSRATGAKALINADKASFSWNYEEGSPGKGTDKAVMIVYNADNGEINYSMGEVSRSDKAGTVLLPYSETGEKLLFYLFFQNAKDEFSVSPSQLAGSVLVA